MVSVIKSQTFYTITVLLVLIASTNARYVRQTLDISAEDVDDSILPPRDYAMPFRYGERIPLVGIQRTGGTIHMSKETYAQLIKHYERQRRRRSTGRHSLRNSRSRY